MASRPAVAALGCFQCRASILRAVASASLPALRAPVAAARSTRFALPIRTFATIPKEPVPPPTETDTEAPPAVDEKLEENLEEKAEERVEEKTEEKEAVEDGDDTQPSSSNTPWYLDVEPPQHAPTQHIAPRPEIPEGSPDVLDPLVKYVYEEMGLDDMTLLDLREMDPPPALGPNLMMLFGTARSERHLHVSASRLVKWLRYHYRIDSRADGLIGPGELKTKLRRLRKKAKLLGSSAIPTGEDDGISTGWICVNLGTIGSSAGEATRFDDEGRMTGFGVSPTGTTLIVQVMTEARRRELNLERLWSGQLKRSVEAEEALKVDGDEFLRKFGKKPTPGPRPRKLQRRPDPRGFSQKRSFSTTRVLASTEQAAQGQAEVSPTVEGFVEEALLAGRHIPYDEALLALRDLLTPVEGHMKDEHIMRACSLLHAMHERGMSVLNTDIIISFMTAIALYSARRSVYAREVLPNLHYLLKRAATTCPTEDQMQELLEALLYRGKMETFWDIWQLPAFHKQPRTPKMYTFLFQLAADTQGKDLCGIVLRKTVHDMALEQPPVMPVGAVWTALRECLLVADPGCEELANKVIADPGGTKSFLPRLNGEFVRMYRRFSLVKAELER